MPMTLVPDQLFRETEGAQRSQIVLRHLYLPVSQAVTTTCVIDLDVRRKHIDTGRPYQGLAWSLKYAHALSQYRSNVPPTSSEGALSMEKVKFRAASGH